MTLSTRFVALVCLEICLSSVLVGQATTAIETDNGLKQFEKWANDFVANPHEDILLPEDWFNQRFDAATASRLNAEYRELAKTASVLPQMIASKREAGQSKVLVSMHRKPIDRTATGLQNAALQRMKQPEPLFSLRLVEPGKDKGFSLLSFVKVDDSFRFAGKMQALSSKKGDMVLDILNTTPLSSMEGLLQEKGLLNTSAEQYLKDRGVLK